MTGEPPFRCIESVISGGGGKRDKASSFIPLDKVVPSDHLVRSTAFSIWMGAQGTCALLLRCERTAHLVPELWRLQRLDRGLLPQLSLIQVQQDNLSEGGLTQSQKANRPQ